MKDTLKRLYISKEVGHLLKDIEHDRTTGYLKIVDLARQYYGNSFSDESYEKAVEAIKDPNNKWVRLINETLDHVDPHVAKVTALNLGYEAFLKGTKTIRENRERYHCNIPWLILFDPTNACNMHCTGCWSGTYGHKDSLSFEDMDKIVTEGKELGAYLYMMTGGEPLVKKKEILRLAKKHHDVEFAIYTNATLIDEEFCKQVAKLGNIIFLMSIEGTKETNDARRGEGHFDAFVKASNLLKKHGIIFGTSICYTSKNYKAVTSDEFYQFLCDQGAHFGFYFHYMPVGDAALDLLLTPEQRLYMIDRIRQVRNNDNPIPFFPMDFQNDGEYVGGCIAGGRNYFHINASGDGEPCVFIHYSDSNIHTHSLLEMLKRPLFMAYHEKQPFNQNHLRPCPMLENPEIIEDIVHSTHAKDTNKQKSEPVEQLTGKCKDYAYDWKPYADVYWKTHKHVNRLYENYAKDHHR